VEDLTFSLKSSRALRAGERVDLNFEVLDGQGRQRSDDIQALMGSLGQVQIVDEGLTTILRPDFVDRRNLQFSVTFPKPGMYKLWFTFKYPLDVRQIGFVIEVK
jgi:hypothetical protein